MRRSFIMHHCFAVVWRRSLELNPCRIKFIKNQGVALWQRRRRRVRRRNRRACEVRLELDSTCGRTGVRPLLSLLQQKTKRMHCCWTDGNSGMPRVARPGCCDAYKRGAAAKLADGYGRALKLTTAFHCFECGANIGICRGRSCSIFGACRTLRSSIATPMPQNVPTRRGTDEPHRYLKLN